MGEEVIGAESRLSEYALTLAEMAGFFKKENVSSSYLKTQTKDKQSTGNFIASLVFQSQTNPNPRKIQGIRWTKAILWLHSYSLAQDFCPPSKQIKDFVDYDIANLSWRQRSIQQKDDYEYVFFMSNFHTKEVMPLLPKATTRGTGVAIWYWKICKSLLKETRVRREFGPQELLTYLDLRKIGLKKLIGRIDDIAKVDDLSADIKAFMPVLGG